MRRKEEEKLRLAEEERLREEEQMKKEQLEKAKREGQKQLARMMEAAKAARAADEFLKSKLDLRSACIDRSNEVLWGPRHVR